jgi:hypothetical protein
VPIERIDKRLSPETLPLIAHTADAYIYENPNALPRVLFATTAQKADFEAILESGAWPPFDPRETVLLQNEPASGPPRRPGRVAIRSYTTTRIEITVESLDGGWVVLNDVWQPWWFATIGKRDAPVLRANVLFRAVEVPPGTYTVVFAFEPLRGAWQAIRGPQPAETSR